MFRGFYEACIMQYKIINSSVRICRGNCYHMLHFNTVPFWAVTIGRQTWLDFQFAVFKDVVNEGSWRE